jgi:hypothetical protein
MATDESRRSWQRFGVTRERKVQAKYRQRRLTICKTWNQCEWQMLEVSGWQNTQADAERISICHRGRKRALRFRPFFASRERWARSGCERVQTEPRGPPLGSKLPPIKGVEVGFMQGPV